MDDLRAALQTVSGASVLVVSYWKESITLESRAAFEKACPIPVAWLESEVDKQPCVDLFETKLSAEQSATLIQSTVSALKGLI